MAGSGILMSIFLRYPPSKSISGITIPFYNSSLAVATYLSTLD